MYVVYNFDEKIKVEKNIINFEELEEKEKELEEAKKINCLLNFTNYAKISNIINEVFI